uniref:hypothetical protein n=1 Tax=Kitasatospora sp. McL0602 TaxID=3439530 RepID=UPI003F8A5955
MDGGGRAGGSVGLIKLLDKHGAEIAADLRRFCGVDIVDWVHGRHSARFVLGLIGTFPDESATVAAMRGGREALGWGPQTYILADLVDAVQALTHVQVAKASKNPRTVDKPKPYARPYAKRAKGGGPNPFAKALARGVGEGGGVLTEDAVATPNQFKLPAAVAARSGSLPKAPPVRLT